MKKIDTKMDVLINYGEFERPVQEFKKLLNSIFPKEEIYYAYLKYNRMVTIIEKEEFKDWNLHLYSNDIHVAICDANCGYDGGSPRGKTFQILQMAGFDVEIEQITTAKYDLEFFK